MWREEEWCRADLVNGTGAAALQVMPLLEEDLDGGPLVLARVVHGLQRLSWDDLAECRPVPD